MLLYLHIPFCDSKCHYCSFNSYTDILDLTQSYMIAMKKQLLFELERFDVKKNGIETIFIGGGTPSALPPKEYEEFFKILKPYLMPNIEITTEANPNSASEDWLRGMRELGINRVSFGVQSFDDKKLKFLGREHSSLEAKIAIEKAHMIGIKNISCDLIYDTILDTKELLTSDLDIVFSLPINHLSSYSLTIEKGTNFFGKNNLLTKDENLASWFIDEVKRRGFNQYEISNFGTYKSEHNLGYWTGKEYIGIGSGAVGFLRDKRFYTDRNVKSYIKNPTKIEIENLTQTELKSEKIFLGLRSEIGVDITLLSDKKLQILKETNKIKLIDTIAYNMDYLLSDEIALFLMED
ncbi:MAG TPA: coproporphyrinogen III oxidase family protein [Campylobacterales bacterium]|nr:coproporphyrinogen III oxidase family protein [Campylobacterales bacterium]